ncbi:hypothetical protein PUR34_14085 [Streptomyces sp. JV185]|uniref:hypothetical protein n=1 Tax=Streptomyces sp. JV185 TaxID=858638 RepID=UPI002E7634A9|nr:hypothetical protein [Streptomyces sp. JV185]MEE1769251.1 hypothetical protein [Streptomyces sp. JV185]
MSDAMPEPGTAAGTLPGSEAADLSGEGADPAAGTPLDPAAPAPLGVVRTPTGNAGVDAELERLADADHLPADGHIEVYEDVHRGLRESLTALDAGPTPAPVPAPMPSYDNRS